MDVRKKLIEILRQTRYEYRRYIAMKDYEKRIAKTDEEFLAVDDSIVGEIPFCADHLIANGVTFATDNNVGSKWIPVTERLPEKKGNYLGWTGSTFMVGYYKGNAVWWIWSKDLEGVDLFTHWMQLPQPPKGE